MCLDKVIWWCVCVCIIVASQFSSTDDVRTLPPCPLLLVLSTEGVLMPYRIINEQSSDDDLRALVHPPQPLPAVSVPSQQPARTSVSTTGPVQSTTIPGPIGSTSIQQPCPPGGGFSVSAIQQMPLQSSQQTGSTTPLLTTPTASTNPSSIPKFNLGASSSSNVGTTPTSRPIVTGYTLPPTSSPLIKNLPPSVSSGAAPFSVTPNAPLTVPPPLSMLPGGATIGRSTTSHSTMLPSSVAPHPSQLSASVRPPVVRMTSTPVPLLASTPQIRPPGVSQQTLRQYSQPVTGQSHPSSNLVSQPRSHQPAPVTIATSQPHPSHTTTTTGSKPTPQKPPATVPPLIRQNTEVSMMLGINCSL